jgi:hypothetical protein
VPVAYQVRVLVDPRQRRARLVLKLPDEVSVSSPTLVLVEQHDEQRRGIHRAVVRGMGTFFEGRQLAVAHLVEDPAWVLVGKSSTRVPWRSPSSASVVAASSGTNGRACRLVKMLSRPNMVMNHGRRAAGRLRRPAVSGENRSAARSIRLR